MFFYIFFSLTIQISISSDELLRDSVIESNTGETYNFQMKFDCPIKEGYVKINFLCSACNKISADRKVWFQANFKDGAFTGLTHEDLFIHNEIPMSTFVPTGKASYNADTYILSYRVDSGNMRYAGVEESTLKCPVVHDAVILDNAGTTYNFQMNFDCPIKEGYVKIDFLCSACNKISADQKVWFQANFKDGAFTGLTHEDLIIHNEIPMSTFVPTGKASYNAETYTLSYRVDSGNMRYAGVRESTLKCPGPALTPTPEPTPLIHDALILENAGETYNFQMKFDCPIKEGHVKINLLCSACNKISADQKVWFQANFVNDTFTGLTHEDLIIHNSTPMSVFVPTDKSSYNANTHILSYRVDSGNMRYAGVEESTLKCPGPSATPRATQSPSVSPEIIVIDSSNITSNGRIVYEEDENQRSLVVMKQTTFTGIDSPVEGGAVYISNMGYQCIGSTFEGCSSTSAGGAVYLSNEYDHDNFFTLENTLFKDNEAKYGGAAYIYSQSKKNRVEVHYCTFVNNAASTVETSDKLFGGSSLYLTARTVNVLNNNFKSNSGLDVRIVNNFKKKTSSFSKSFFSINNDKLIIANCNFEVDRNSLCSIFFVRGNNGMPCELRSCTFSGELPPNAHFIDGQTISKNSPKLIVKKCKFASSFKRALNLDINNDFMSVDLNDQSFDVSDLGIKEKKSLSAAYKIIIAVAVPAVALAVIAAVIIIKKKSKSNEKDEKETESEIHNNLINNTLL